MEYAWLDQLMGAEPQEEPPSPAQNSPAAPDSEHAPTVELPRAVSAEPDLSEAPTAKIPDLSQMRTDSGPDLLYSGVDTPKSGEHTVPAAHAPVRKAEKPARSGPGIGLILGCVAGALVLSLVLGVFCYGLVLKGGSTIYPNVYVAGINVGGMNRQQAVQAVDEAMAAAYSSATLKVQLPDRTLTFSPEQTNVALNAEEAIDEAMQFGRSGNPFSAVTALFRAKNTEHYIDLQTMMNLDTDYIRSVIEQTAAQVEEKPVPTQVRFDENAGELVVDVGYPDRSLDVDGLYEVVCSAFMNGDYAPVTWEYDEVPCEAVDLEAYFKKYGTEAVDARYDEQAHRIEESVSGFGFDVQKASQQIASAAAGSRIVIPLIELEPEVTTEILEKEMFGTTLFKTSSNYVVNANRTTNLTLACEAINGTILNPDDVFSFNNIVGERTADKGYKPATVYSGGQSLEELGGGVCQVASTIYYATLHLDLEQVHREPHQFVVTYVPYGMDATVYWGHIDYQFRNTLSHPIRILADTEGGSVNITFQGVKETDNTVKMEYTILETYPWQEIEELDETKEVGYRQVEVTPYTGYKVVTYKIIQDADGNQISREQEAISVYSKRDQTVIVGPSEAPSEPDPWPDDSGDPGDPWDPWPEGPDSDDSDLTGPDLESPWP